MFADMYGHVYNCVYMYIRMYVYRVFHDFSAQLQEVIS
jgi:hypothetical protein